MGRFGFFNFSERAQRVLNAAGREAADFYASYVGTEHILLGLLDQDDHIVQEITDHISYQAAKDIVASLQSDTPALTQRPSRLEMTPRAKRLISMANLTARRLGQGYIGPELLWHSLLSDKDSMGCAVVVQMGVNTATAMEQIMSAIRDGMESPERTPDEQPRNPSGPEDSRGNGPNSALSRYSRDLTRMAEDRELDPVIGRETEIERLIQILIRRTKNNPVLIGEPGVGKSAVVEGLAQRIVDGAVPDMLEGKRVLSLDISSMVAGSKYRGEFEERLKRCIEEIRKAGNILLFVDEMHTLVGAGNAEGSLDAANILKPALARGEIQCIGATTLDEYRKHIEKDAALARRFQPVTVGEPSGEEAIAILFGLRDRYEAHHQVRITDDAVRASVHLSERYIADRFLPDKAIDLMDEACSRVRIASYTAPPDVKKEEKRLEVLQMEKKDAVNHQDFERAARLRDEERCLKQEIEAKKNSWANKKTSAKDEVSEEDVAQVVAGWTGIPVSRMTETEAERLRDLESELHKRVIGQDEAVSALAHAIRRARTGLKDPKRPIGSFLFLGPTGVGKTELCRALGEAMFGDENAVIRIDMSEYMEKFTTSRLIGAAPGYVGYEEGGQLTEAVRRKPYSVVLLDEIEKAHPDVFNMLLQILEDGRLTDNTGRVVSFKNTVIVMTSNAGAHALRTGRSMGFGSGTVMEQGNYERMKETVMKEVKELFRPEFINRLDELIVFHSLTEQDIHRITELMLRQVVALARERELELSWDPEVVDYLAEAGYDPQYGARPLRRLIQRTVEDTLSEEMISGSIRSGEKLHLYMDEEGRIAVAHETARLPAQAEKK